MSQAGSLNSGGGGGTTIEKINVQTGTSPVVTTNNTITFNGAVVAAGTNPVRTDGTATSTMALEVQTSQAIASTDATKIGLAAFNSADFSVDANGFVSSTSSGITTIDGDVGSVTGATVHLVCAPAANGGTATFSGSGTTLTFNSTDSNSNTGIGLYNLVNLTSGTYNTAFGGDACAGCRGGSNNAALGFGALNISHNDTDNTAIGFGTCEGINGGSFNTGIGSSSIQAVVTGSHNIGIGYQAGNSYSSSESSNIMIGNIGVNGENNTIRIGTSGSSAGEQNTCFIAGIDGVTITGSTVLCSSTGQLGDVVSAARYKEEISTINDTSTLLKLNPVSFKYKDEKEKYIHYGLIAEEVEKILPELVVYDHEKKPYSVKYHEMPALLLAEIQKLRKEVNELKARS